MPSFAPRARTFLVSRRRKQPSGASSWTRSPRIARFHCNLPSTPPRSYLCVRHAHMTIASLKDRTKDVLHSIGLTDLRHYAIDPSAETHLSTSSKQNRVFRG